MRKAHSFIITVIMLLLSQQALLGSPSKEERFEELITVIATFKKSVLFTLADENYNHLISIDTTVNGFTLINCTDNTATFSNNIINAGNTFTLEKDNALAASLQTDIPKDVQENIDRLKLSYKDDTNDTAFLRQMASYLYSYDPIQAYRFTQQAAETGVAERNLHSLQVITSISIMCMKAYPETVAYLQNNIKKQQAQGPNAKEIKYDYYNMACAYSLWGKLDKAIDTLKEGLLIDKHFVLNSVGSDTDFDNIRDTAEFKNLINSFSEDN